VPAAAAKRGRTRQPIMQVGCGGTRINNPYFADAE
jgi:hypothetical protein